MPIPSAAFLGDFLLGPVVVTGDGDIAARYAIEQSTAVRDACPLTLRLQFKDAAFDVLVVQPAAASQRSVKLKISILANTRTVVHQADDANQCVIRDAVEQRQHVERRNLAPQMQEVLGLQKISVAECIKIDDAIAECADALLVEPKIAEAERVEHGGDAGSGALRIVGDHGGA
jgi:hypothetical protein